MFVNAQIPYDLTLDSESRLVFAWSMERQEAWVYDAESGQMIDAVEEGETVRAREFLAQMPGGMWVPFFSSLTPMRVERATWREG